MKSTEEKDISFIPSNSADRVIQSKKRFNFQLFSEKKKKKWKSDYKSTAVHTNKEEEEGFCSFIPTDNGQQQQQQQRAEEEEVVLTNVLIWNLLKKKTFPRPTVTVQETLRGKLISIIIRYQIREIIGIENGN